MNFEAFLTLLILGVISTIVIHSIIRYRILGGVDGFLAKWVAGWIGAWLGSPVLGHWWFHIQNIYIIPALIGAFVGSFFCVVVYKAAARATVNATATKVAPAAAATEMLRKAS